jgi:hypothetical protein
MLDVSQRRRNATRKREIHNNNSIPTEGKSANPSQPPSAQPPASSPPPRSEKIVTDSKVATSPWWKFWKATTPEAALTRATVWLVMATFALAAIALGQAGILLTTDSSTRKAADAAIKSATAAETALQLAKQEQRPIVWLTNDLSEPSLAMDRPPADPTAGQITWSWHRTNYGKSPAVHISYRHFMRIEGKLSESFGVRPEGSSSGGAPLPTGKVDYSSVVSAPGITPQEFSRLMQTDNAIGIEGEITYEDVAGAQYRTTFCLQHLASGAIGYCHGRNDIR